MTSGKIANLGPNIMVNPKTNVAEDTKSSDFLDVMNRSVSGSNPKASDVTEQLKTSDSKPVDNKDSKTVNKADDTAKNTNDTKADKTQDKSAKADDTAKADKTNNADAKATKTVKATNDNTDVKADMNEAEELPAEVIELVNEIINNFQADVKDILTEALDITEDELANAMADMNTTFADLLNPKQVTELMVEVADVEDSVSLVLDENLSNALSSIRDLINEATSKTGLEVPQIQQVVAESEGAIEIPVEMMSEANVDIQDIEIPELPKEQVLRDAQPKMENQPINAPTQEEAKAQVVAESVAEEEAPVITKPVDTEADEVTDTQNTKSGDDTFTIKQNTQSDTNNSNQFQGNERPSDNNNTQFNMNVTVDNANVQVETPVEVEARPQMSRFDTMQLISQIADAARANISEDVKTIEMILNPESLGKIYLNVTQKQGALHAQLVAQNEAIMQALEEQMAQLKESLNKAGIKVEAVEVSVGTHEFERNLEEGMHGQEEQARQQAEQNSQRRKPISINLNNLDELQGLMSEEDMLVAQMMRDQGNTMNVQA